MTGQNLFPGVGATHQACGAMITADLHTPTVDCVWQGDDLAVLLVSVD